MVEPRLKRPVWVEVVPLERAVRAEARVAELEKALQQLTGWFDDEMPWEDVQKAVEAARGALSGVSPQEGDGVKDPREDSDAS